MFRLMLCAPAPLWLVGCAAPTSYDPMLGADPVTIDAATPDVAPSDAQQPSATDDDSDSVDFEPADRWDAVTADASGTMPTAGSFDTLSAQPWIVADAHAIDFRFDVFTPGGWAMMAGAVLLEGPLEPDQELPVLSWTLGCSGPTPVDFSFDAPAEDTVVTTALGPDGQLQLIVAMDFGPSGWLETVTTLAPR